MIRLAKLFETGEYPDKGLTVTVKDLDTWADSFRPCPVKIEHTDSAFDGVLGNVVKIFRKGEESGQLPGRRSEDHGPVQGKIHHRLPSGRRSAE